VECYAFQPKASHHLDFRTLSRRRAELGTRRVLLTHMSQEMLDRLGEIDWEIAEDGLLVEL
jgi:phosphoribosyl 1,2-cyclic phosphodiesterase